MRLLIVFLALSCVAFGELPKREVFGVIGAGKAYDDEGSLGSGLNGGGGFGYRLSPRFGVEAEFNAFRTSRSFGAAGFTYRARGFHLLGNGLLYLNRSETAQAFVLFGAGMTHFKNETNFAGVIGRSANGSAFNAGFGVKGYISRNFSVRPEFRLIAGSAPGAVEAPFVDMRFSIGAGYHW